MFKVGDFVKVKPNTALETGETVNDWAGKVEEVYPQEKTCLLILDAQTINSFDDDDLMSCIEDGVEPYEYIFYFDDLELAKRRDTNQQAKQALARLADRMTILEDEEGEDLEELQKQWIEEFMASTYYEMLNEPEQKNTDFVISTFMDYMDGYEGIHPTEWNTASVKIICLEIIPRKVSADIETFEHYGVILPQFFEFLGSKGYISKADVLSRVVKKLKSKIVVAAQNPDNWGIAKLMLMSAKEEGFDLSKKEDLEQFLALQQLPHLKPTKNPLTIFGKIKKLLFGK